jgi:hypothetical protein
MSALLYIFRMSSEERSTWILGSLAIGSLTVYLAVILGRRNGGPLTDVAYVLPMLWTIGASIVAAIVITIAFGVVRRSDGHAKDQRDREIHQRGEYIGQSFVTLGAVAALGMAMAQWHHFWIANVIYLCLNLSAIVGSVAKLVAYRRGFVSW